MSGKFVFHYFVNSVSYKTQTVKVLRNAYSFICSMNALGLTSTDTERKQLVLINCFASMQVSGCFAEINKNKINSNTDEL